MGLLDENTVLVGMLTEKTHSFDKTSGSPSSASQEGLEGLWWTMAPFWKLVRGWSNGEGCRFKMDGQAPKLVSLHKFQAAICW